MSSGVEHFYEFRVGNSCHCVENHVIGNIALSYVLTGIVEKMVRVDPAQHLLFDAAVDGRHFASHCLGDLNPESTDAAAGAVYQ